MMIVGFVVRMTGGVKALKLAARSTVRLTGRQKVQICA